MRVLVGWDDRQEADLIRLYLQVDENGIAICTDHEQMLALAESPQRWDAILMATDWPDHDAAFDLFERLCELRPGCPIVGACRPDEVYRIARFLTSGLRAYVIRDDAADFMFLLQSLIDGAVRQVEAERERLVAEKLRREIDSVRQLQEKIIPRNVNCPDGYQIAARYESSQIRVLGGVPVTMAGGDYYDIFSLADDSLVILVGDASGHGMKACMSIMTMHTLIRLLRDNEFKNTARFVEYVNDLLCQQQIVNEDGGFITLLYAILNPHTHLLQWTSAGHPLPLVLSLENGEVTPLGDNDAGGLPLGIVPGAEYTVQVSEIPPGSRLALYTDGLAEAFNAETEGHQEFGQAGLCRTLKDSADVSLEETVQNLFDASCDFTGGHGRHDDTSVVIVERASLGPEALHASPGKVVVTGS